MKKILFPVLFLISFNAFSYVDMSLNYTHSMRKVEGIETDAEPDPGAAITTNSGYTVNWAWYMWEYTALELNYSHFTERLVDDRALSASDGSFTILETDATVITEVAGAGIRQSFANRKSAIIPSLSIGYAKYTTSATKTTKVDIGGTVYEVNDEQEKEVFSSSYASFSLRFRFTQLMGFTLAAKTIMPDFETKEAENNVTYSAGFSWIF